MKSNTFLLILAIYYFTGGCLALFNASGLLADFGAKNIDQYHIATTQYLGQTNFGLALMAYLIRMANDFGSKKAFLWGAVFLAFSAELKGLYDMNVLLIPTTTSSWVDTSIRLVIGFASLYFATRKKED
jgi:hypothetical protein